mmetsp:Transcript_31498/g.84009  ORF Transcript_31498/g.84009 Transcript_31498/m.84009 type:complete len:682 (-) Transcript_31498:171-2216(-)
MLSEGTVAWNPDSDAEDAGDMASAPDVSKCIAVDCCGEMTSLTKLLESEVRERIMSTNELQHDQNRMRKHIEAQVTDLWMSVSEMQRSLKETIERCLRCENGRREDRAAIQELLRCQDQFGRHREISSDGDTSLSPRSRQLGGTSLQVLEEDWDALLDTWQQVEQEKEEVDTRADLHDGARSAAREQRHSVVRQVGRKLASFQVRADASDKRLTDFAIKLHTCTLQLQDMNRDRLSDIAQLTDRVELISSDCEGTVERTKNMQVLLEDTAHVLSRLDSTRFQIGAQESHDYSGRLDAVEHKVYDVNTANASLQRRLASLEKEVVDALNGVFRYVQNDLQLECSSTLEVPFASHQTTFRDPPCGEVRSPDTVADPHTPLVPPVLPLDDRAAEVSLDDRPLPSDPIPQEELALEKPRASTLDVVREDSSELQSQTCQSPKPRVSFGGSFGAHGGEKTVPEPSPIVIRGSSLPNDLSPTRVTRAPTRRNVAMPSWNSVPAPDARKGFVLRRSTASRSPSPRETVAPSPAQSRSSQRKASVPRPSAATRSGSRTKSSSPERGWMDSFQAPGPVRTFATPPQSAKLSSPRVSAPFKVAESSPLGETGVAMSWSPSLRSPSPPMSFVSAPPAANRGPTPPRSCREAQKFVVFGPSPQDKQPVGMSCMGPLRSDRDGRKMHSSTAAVQ